MKYLLIMSSLVISLFAKMPDEVQWVTQIKQEDQKIVILFIRNKLNTYVANELKQRIKIDNELEIFLFSSNYMRTLSKLSTKNPTLKEMLHTEGVNLGKMYVLGFNNKKVESYYKYSELLNHEFQKYPKKELKAVFNRYKNEFDLTSNAIIKYVENVVSDSKSSNSSLTFKASLAKIISDEIQKTINQNDGKIKVSNATYLKNTYHYDNKVIIGYEISKKELIKTTIQQSNMDDKEALEAIESLEFKENAKKIYPQDMHNRYCTSMIKDALKKNVVLTVNLSFDDGISIINPIVISHRSCLSYGHDL